MSRLPYLALALAALVLSGALLWYLAYDLGQTPPPVAEVPTLEAPVRVYDHAPTATTIEAASWPDALRALGYVHGRDHTWALLLYRQTALGALATWFGPEVADLDRLGRWLGWAALARRTEAALPEADRALLAAYSDGVNAALRSASARYREEVVLLDLPLEPWQPWHTLALERLFAWLAHTPARPDSSALPDSALPEDVRTFLSLDDGLRDWLHLSGFAFSQAWTQRQSDTAYVAQRHVYGHSALPLYHDVRLLLPDDTLRVATLPGTPFFPAGQSTRHTWALLWSSTARLEPKRPVPDALPARFERIEIAGGSERLVQAFQRGDTLYLSSRSPRPGDSLWVLTWPGLTPGSDLAAWQALATDDPQPFRLLRGDGLRVELDGRWTILGAPSVQFPLRDGVLVSNQRWSRHAAAHLDSMSRASPSYLPSGAWQDDTYSRWAARLTPWLLTRLETLPAASPRMTEALTYLHNWDFRYTRASIAATILEAWMTRFREATGALPVPGDTTIANADAFARTLGSALDALTDAYGADLSLWRWEQTAPRTRYVPVWSATASHRRIDLPPDGRRFAPLFLPGRGHPSTLYWGASALPEEPAGPAVWESWTTSRHPSNWTVRPRHVDRRSSLLRILEAAREAPSLRFDDPPATRITRLEPPHR
ncbi:hypothetical protein AWN76_006170 [Rhodothermaceae bacterium RA]|nr:hypothetical protein AWN76_006170 [Rhodothermaceae bacterium RA]